jgi:hypothetical protein
VVGLGDQRTMKFAIIAREIAEDIAREIIGDSAEDSCLGVFVVAALRSEAAGGLPGLRGENQAWYGGLRFVRRNSGR